MFRLLSCVVFAGMLAGSICGSANAEPPLAGWIDQAELVCVGVPETVDHPLEKIEPWGQLPITMLETTVKVQVVLKGDPGRQRLTLPNLRFNQAALMKEHPNGIGVAGAHPVPTPMVARRSYLMFIRKGARGGDTLVNPYGSGASIIPIAPVDRAVVEGLPVARAVLLVLLNSVESANPDVRLGSLRALGGFGPARWEFEPTLDNSFIHARIARVFGNDHQLDALLSGRALPALVKASASQDPEIRAAGLISRADLQDVSAIPMLEAARASAALKDWVEESLAGYKVTKAIPALASLVKHNNAAVRRGALRALVASDDWMAVPFLIDGLPQSEGTVRYRIAAALAAMTYSPSEGTAAAFQAHEAERVQYWQKWAADHKAELESIRGRVLERAQR